MVKKQFVCALGAAVILGICSTANAGGVVRINDGDSPDLALATIGSAVSYTYSSLVDTGTATDGWVGYVADVNLQGFLLCNHVDPAPGASPYSTFLIPRHGTWTYGLGIPAGTSTPVPMAAVPGATFVSYNNQRLDLTVDSDTQCFRANQYGENVTNLHHIFVSGFDFGVVAANSSNTSAVTIAVDHVPTASDPTFVYTINVSIGGASTASTSGQGQAHTHSLSSFAYFLREGYDTSAFNQCYNMAGAPGQPVSASMTKQVTCTLKQGVDWSTWLTQPGHGTDKPVVTAALFDGGAGPNPDAQYFGDNLAFGYPVVTPPVTQ